MNTIRQNVIDKLNSQTQFELTTSEIEFIVENWMTTHSQHLSKAMSVSGPLEMRVDIDKESIFKHF